MAYHSNIVAQDHIVAQFHIVARWWMVQEQQSANHVVLIGATDSIPPASSYKLKKTILFFNLILHIFLQFFYTIWSSIG